MDTYADDLATLVEALDLRNAIHVGHSNWRRRSGSVPRKARHPARSQSRADQCRATTDAEDGGQSRRHANRRIRQASFRRPGGPLAVLEGSEHAILRLQSTRREDFRRRARVILAPGDDGRLPFPASYFCIKAFSETDLTEDLKKFDVPTLIMHGDDDQIVPIGASALLSSKIVKGAVLKVYKGAPHGMCTTLKHQVNEELLAFFKA